jgi:tetratricopeptide (TPR) repeat protein
MLHDAQGLMVSTESPDAIDAINQFAEQLLGYGKNVDVILQGIAADPDSVLINAHAAALQLFAETATASDRALPYLQRAQANLTRATERERLYLKAIAAWAAGDLDQAIASHTQLAEQAPRDLVSVQIGQYHHFYRGDSQGLLNLIETVMPANRDNHYAYGMLAFALEQCHRLSEAEAAGRQAVAMNRRDPWAHHAVAHVMDTQGRTEEGIAWMESLAEVWEDCGSFRVHNWWHVALYYLDRRDFARVLDLYDQQIWGRAVKDYSPCQVDAIALLLRLDLRGVDVGDRWQKVGIYLSDRMDDHIMPLTDLHVLYGLVRSEQNQLADAMLHSIKTYAETAKPFIQPTWLEVVLPAAHGLVAHARGDRAAAILYLDYALPRLQQVGGSHAQRDLFQQIYMDVLRCSN